MVVYRLAIAVVCTSVHVLITHTLHAVVSRKAVLYCLLTVFILITVVFLVTLIVIMVLPGKLEGSVRDFFIYSTVSATIPLDSLVNRQWLSTMDLEFDAGCNGRMALINSSNCSSSNLPVQMNTLSSRTDKVVPSPIYIYSLPGSSFNVSIPNNRTKVVDDPHVWFVFSLEAYLRLRSQITTGGRYVYECGKYYTDAACYSTKDNIGRTIMLSVNHPSYYSIFFTDSKDSSYVSRKQYSLEWSFTNVTYNFTEIMARYATLYPIQSVLSMEPVPVKLSKPFDFAHKHNYCALLDFKCTDERFHKLTISNFKRRWDILTLLSVLYLLALFVLILVLVMVIILYYCKAATSSKKYKHTE